MKAQELAAFHSLANNGVRKPGLEALPAFGRGDFKLSSCRVAYA
jgi:hypothetical protein